MLTFHFHLNQLRLLLTVRIKCLIFRILNILRLIPKIMKLCHDCLTPISRNSKEVICAICKKDRALKQSSTSED